MKKKTVNNKQPSGKKLNIYLVLGFIFLIPTIAIGVFVSDAIVPVVQKQQLVNNSLVIDGRVTAKDSSFSPHRGGGITTYSIDYTFSPQGETGATSVQTRTNYAVTQSEYDRYEVGSSIAIAHLESKPAVNAPNGTLHHMGALFYLLMQLVFGLIVPIIIMNLIYSRYPKVFKKRGWVGVGIWVGILAACLAVGILLGALITRGLELLIL